MEPTVSDQESSNQGEDILGFVELGSFYPGEEVQAAIIAAVSPTWILDVVYFMSAWVVQQSGIVVTTIKGVWGDKDGEVIAIFFILPGAPDDAEATPAPELPKGVQIYTLEEACAHLGLGTGGRA